jgi:mono/diheme cytochrome c family protein
MAKWIDGRRLQRALVPLACLLTAAAVSLAAGCGDSGGGDSSSAPARTVVQVEHVARDRWTYARARFHETCAGCHTLADARATGRRFNLDHDGDIDEARARYAIEHGEPGMPAWGGVLSKREFEELVAYVSTVDRHTPGETNWSWQMRLRTEGENWKPGRQDQER